MPPMEYMYETKIIKPREINRGSLNGSKRERLEIMAEILYYCNQQKTKTTSIMYKVNLNYAQLKKHLGSLVSQGLLTTDKKEYATTQKGQRFLELFVQLNDILTT